MDGKLWTEKIYSPGPQDPQDYVQMLVQTHTHTHKYTISNRVLNVFVKAKKKKIFDKIESLKIHKVKKPVLYFCLLLFIDLFIFLVH